MQKGVRQVDFEKIYSDYYTYVYRFLLSLGRDESLAEELTAETFYRAYINLARLRDPALCPTWLCSIAKNLYFTHIKHESKFDSLDEKLPCGTDVALSVERKVLAEQIVEQALRLERIQTEVFLLHAMEGISLKDISLAFGKSESWARVVFYRAKQRIADKL